jgi:hypothetical protein
MVRVARFPQPSRAFLGRIALERAGIAVELRGMDRAVLVGELPDAGGELWVDEADAARALEVLRLAEAPSEDGPDVACPACAAPNPAGFSECWKCQAVLHDATPDEEEAPVPSPPAAPPVPAAPQGKWGGAAKLLGFALAVVAVVKLYAWLSQPEPRRPHWKDEWVGSCLVRRSLDGALYSRHCDANNNGLFEQGETFDSKGRRMWRWFDENENGHAERSLHYGTASDEHPIETHRDPDDDGRVEQADLFIDGQQLHYSDTNHDEVFDRLVIERDGGRLVQVLTRDGWQAQQEE